MVIVQVHFCSFDSVVQLEIYLSVQQTFFFYLDNREGEKKQARKTNEQVGREKKAYPNTIYSEL